MNEYLIEYGVYVNCHISHVEERKISAVSYEEAKGVAEKIGDAMERELSPSYPGDDVWVNVEDIIEAHE